MTNLMVFLVVLALLGYAIERNHRRRRPGRMSGSTNFEDRDEPRVAADLRALPPSRRDRQRSEHVVMIPAPRRAGATATSHRR